MVRAFAEDPVLNWTFPPRTRERGGRRFFSSRLRVLLAHEDVWTTDDLAGAAAWAPPDRWRLNVRETLALLPSLPLMGLRAPRVTAGLTRIELKHPAAPPHWYLAILGTDPPHQGRGVGSALLAPVLERCDRDGVAAYLETGKERNLDFYARHGFQVTEELRLPKGPPAWLMWRDAR